ncbi:MAG TPA: ABC transporter substrate-binding protein [Ferruginibacter sp.]|nr:ABC transporter substrate-binding protein [Ferruginibacter sp.]
MKVGILYPSSKAHPGITAEFLGGLKSFFKQQGIESNVTLVAESIGLGGVEKDIYERAEKLLMVEEVDVLVAYIDLRILAFIEPLLFSSGKLVIVVNPGANLPTNWISQPNVVFLTLQHAFLCSLTGALPTDASGQKAAVATTFYDCGYLHSAAMVKSFIRSGGTIAFNYVNNQRYDANFSIKELADHLASDDKASSLLCIFDEFPASIFYDRLNELENIDGQQLFVSPMMLQEKALEKHSGFKFDIEGYMPWDIRSENDSNTLFGDSLRTHAKKEPNIFSLLGWETGLILQQVMINAKDDFSDGVGIVETLSKADMNGPRGKMKIDPHTNYVTTPIIKCSIKNHSGKIEKETIGIPEDEWNKFTEAPAEGITSGWTNTYLCY